jgi:hypothetical protein
VARIAKGPESVVAIFCLFGRLVLKAGPMKSGLRLVRSARGSSEPLTDAQRDFLLSRLRHFAEDATRDKSQATRRLAEVVTWLEGGRASRQVRLVLEELMAASDRGTGYRQAVFEHEAYADALKSLESSG